jgi:hypothetical protein
MTCAGWLCFGTDGRLKILGANFLVHQTLAEGRVLTAEGLRFLLRRARNEQETGFYIRGLVLAICRREVGKQSRFPLLTLVARFRQSDPLLFPRAWPVTVALGNPSARPAERLSERVDPVGPGVLLAGSKLRKLVRSGGGRGRSSRSGRRRVGIVPSLAGTYRRKVCSALRSHAPAAPSR